MEIRSIAVKSIVVDKKNARVINKKTPEWKSFVESIKHGVEVPLIVATTEKDGEFVLVAGHRRLEAAKEAKLTEVPCDVRGKCSETDRFEIRTIENLQRQDLTPIEEGLQIKRLLASADDTHTMDSIAEKLGKSKSWVIRRARLAELHPDIIKSLRVGVMSYWPIECLVLLA
jgi:ParB family chromosome partitioning protein